MRAPDLAVRFEGELATCLESSLSPDISGYFDNQFQFRDLILNG
jgi:hypothetical protein